MKRFKLLSWIASAVLLNGTVTYAHVVTDWNTAALDAIRAGRTPRPIAGIGIGEWTATRYLKPAGNRPRK